MARRLALLALLAAASLALRTPYHPLDLSASDSDSGSMDPFALWDDYESYETTPPPRSRTKNVSAKVILRAKPPKVNVTKPKPKKDLSKSTMINIESHTNFIMTKKPVSAVVKPNRAKMPLVTYVAVSEEYELVDAGEASTRRPVTRRPAARPPTTRRPTTKRPPTTRRTTSKPKTKQTRKTTPCPPKNTAWLSSYFHKNKVKPKSPKKQSNSGLIKSVYNWVSKSAMRWLMGSKPKKPVTTTTTTAAPVTMPTSNWFQSLLESEENDDGAYAAVENKKPTKKPMKKNYKGYQLLRAYPDAQWKVHELLELQEEGEGSGLTWWTAPSMNGSTDIVVPPDLLADVKDHLNNNNIEFDVVIWDLQKAISYENPRLSKKQRLELEQLRGHPLTWRRYHRYADILRYLEYLQHSHADLVELIPLGRSSEGLPLVAVKISLPANETQAKEAKGGKKKWQLRSRMKPAVWLEGGAHAREWIAPAVATWMLHALVEGEKGLGAEYEVLKQADFYILPVLNPDGYEHSHTHDRLWVKTRSRLADPDDYSGWFPWNWGKTDCVGVDADRNWDYHWGEEGEGGAARDPCADAYAGPHPFSEPETRAVADFLSEHRGRMKVYITLHAYSQAWLLPSAAAHASFGDDDGALAEMGRLATAALADLYGTKYRVGTATEIRQPASGMSHDWAKARAGIKYSYHVDLRDSYGPYGFLLPGSQIVSTARETWQAVKAIVDNLHS